MVSTHEMPLGRVPDRHPAFRCSLTGEIDIARSEELLVLVDDFRRSNATDAVIDLTELTFMDSIGFGAFVALLATACSRGGSVTLVRPAPIVRRVLTLLSPRFGFEIVG